MFLTFHPVPSVEVVIVNGPARRGGQTARLGLLALAAVAVVLAASGCATAAPPASTAPTIAELSTSAMPPPTAVRRPAEQPFIEEPDPVTTTIRITVADQTITAQLADNPTAQDLAALLPLTLSITDFNQVEKVAELPRPLTVDGVPAGADPDINDIGYYAPSRSLVFYYGDVGYWSGIVRIGRFNDRDIELIEHQQDGTEIRIDRA